MPESPQHKEYFHFLHWFQQTYPDLYVKYWKGIAIPQTGEKLSVSIANVDTADYERLLQVEYDYYSNGGINKNRAGA